jgi:hypothetical protein
VLPTKCEICIQNDHKQPAKSLQATWGGSFQFRYRGGWHSPRVPALWALGDTIPMQTKRKIVIAGVIACRGLLVVWSSMRPQVEVRGPLSQQDVAELIRLAHVERRRDIIDWSPTPQPHRWNIREIPHKWKRSRFNSAPVIRIDQMPDDKAEVTVGTGSLIRRYKFVNMKQRWKHASPEFE